MKAAYYPSLGQVALHDVPEPELRHSDEIKIRVCFVGVCDDDISLYKGDNLSCRCRNRSSGMNFPVRSKIWANWPITRASALATPSAATHGISAAHAAIANPGWRPIAATQPVSPFWQSTLC